jgi:hypothetical protein
MKKKELESRRIRTTGIFRGQGGDKQLAMGMEELLAEEGGACISQFGTNWPYKVARNAFGICQDNTST